MKKTFRTLLTITLLWSLTATPARAVTIYANGNCTQDGNGLASGCASAANGLGARTTIQAAVNQAATGDIVKIVPYQYTINGRPTVYFENVLISKTLTLEADTSGLPATGPPTAYWTVIDGDEDNDRIGDNGDATVTWNSGVGGTIRHLMLEGGFKNTGSVASEGAGLRIAGPGTSVIAYSLMVRYNDTGIVVENGAAPVIKQNKIYLNDNSAIVIKGSSTPIIGGNDNCAENPQTCTGTNNSDANKIYSNSRKPSGACGTIVTCEFTRPAGCAAIAVLDSSSPRIWGNLIYSNKQAGITVSGQATPSIIRNEIKGNGSTAIGLLTTGDTEIKGNLITNGTKGINILGSQTVSNSTNNILIEDNEIVSHKTAAYASGIFICQTDETGSGSTSVKIDKCNVRNNATGISCWHNASPQITNSIISRNYENLSGGGIHCTDHSSPIITNCTITDNTVVSTGGGLYCTWNSSPKVVNSILWGNKHNLTVPSEIFLDPLSTVEVAFSNVQQSSGIYSGTGNINATPQFTDDYHLTSASPCIDTGTDDNTLYSYLPADDIDNETRPQPGSAGAAAKTDIGADEYATIPTVLINTNKAAFTTGETIELIPTVRVGSVPTTADVYLRIVFPDGSMEYLDYFATTPTPLASSWLVENYGPAVYFSHTLDGSEPSGEYRFDIYLTEPGTNNLIGNMNSVKATFTP